jgi:hypothetical protein
MLYGIVTGYHGRVEYTLHMARLWKHIYSGSQAMAFKTIIEGRNMAGSDVWIAKPYLMRESIIKLWCKKLKLVKGRWAHLIMDDNTFIRGGRYENN